MLIASRYDARGERSVAPFLVLESGRRVRLDVRTAIPDSSPYAAWTHRRADAEPRARTSGQRFLFWLGVIVLGISAVCCAFVTLFLLQFAHQVTCGPTPPVAWRHQILFTAEAVYAALAIAAGLCLWRGRDAGLVVALLLAVGALGGPPLAFLFTLSSAAMC